MHCFEFGELYGELSQSVKVCHGVASSSSLYPEFIILLRSTKIRLASVNGCRRVRRSFVLCLIFARQRAGHSRSTSSGNDLASIQHRIPRT